MKGKVEKYLLDKIEKYGSIHLSLLDPQKIHLDDIKKITKDIKMAGSTGVMIGGSTIYDPSHLNKFVTTIKESVDLPIILFPNNITSVTSMADAVWFMSLFNSRNPYYITGAQMLAAPIIKQFRLETLPMAYLIVGREAGTVGFIGDANPIPYNKPEIAASYALVASFFGMRFVYLEAGSGVNISIPSEFISYIHKAVPSLTLIVGGGIKEAETAFKISKAGADILVTGTLIENVENRLKHLTMLVDAIKSGACLKRDGK